MASSSSGLTDQLGVFPGQVIYPNSPQKQRKTSENNRHNPSNMTKSNFDVFCLVLPHLRSVVVAVKSPDCGQPTFSVSQRFLYISNLHASPLKVRLPFPVLLKPVVISRHSSPLPLPLPLTLSPSLSSLHESSETSSSHLSDHIKNSNQHSEYSLVTLRLQPDQSSIDAYTLTPDLSSTSSITCRSCSTSLVPFISTSKNLPPDGWEDLLECWMCHNENFDGARLNNARQGLVPKDQMWVTVANVRVDHGDLRNVVYSSDTNVRFSIVNFSSVCLVISTSFIPSPAYLPLLLPISMYIYFHLEASLSHLHNSITGHILPALPYTSTRALLSTLRFL